MYQTTRRKLLKVLGSGAIFLLSLPVINYFFIKGKYSKVSGAAEKPCKENKKSDVYWTKNGNPAQNIQKTIEMMGGIYEFIGRNDIVVLKPNAQWWNQGRTNLWAMKGFIDLVLSIPDFQGEIIIAENHHFMDSALPKGEEDDVRGWVKLSEINGDIEGENHSLNSLVELYNKKNILNVSKYCWRDGGPKRDLWGNGQNGGVVRSPEEGDGYVWSDIDYTYRAFLGLKKWKVKMTYPVFTSKFSGITVDLKNGAFLRDGKGGGKYLPDKPVKLINFAVINDHGEDTGITSSIKNYMGITDLSCGDWGVEPKGYTNVHFCGGQYRQFAKAGPLGCHMRTIKKAELNIVTAEWVGWGHRTDINKANRMKSLLASKDPVALDYIGAKHLVYPLSKDNTFHDPDNKKSPIYKFLKLAQETMKAGNMNDESINIHSFDFSSSV